MIFVSFKKIFFITMITFQFSPFCFSATQEEADITRWNQLEKEDQLGTLSDEIRSIRQTTQNHLPTHLVLWLKETTKAKQHPILIFRLIDHLALRGSLSDNDLKVIATLLIVSDIHAGQDAKCIQGEKEYAQADATRKLIRQTLGTRLAPHIKELNQHASFQDALKKTLEIRHSKESPSSYTTNPAWILNVSPNSYINLYFTSLLLTGGLTFGNPELTTLQFYEQRKSDIENLRAAFIASYVAAHQTITTWEQFFNETRNENFKAPAAEAAHRISSKENEELTTDAMTEEGPITKVFDFIGVPKFW